MREKDEREGVERGRTLRRTVHGDHYNHGGRYREQRYGFVHHLDRTTTSFYFTNFPVDVKVMDLWGLFSKFGRVGEVYIPQKLDKNGKKFGFVKFKEVKDAMKLEGRLGDVWWETYKLRINLSRFNRSVRVPKQLSFGEVETKMTETHKQHTTAVVTQGKSFRNALNKDVRQDLQHGLAIEKKKETERIQQKCMVATVRDDLLCKLQASYVGFLVENSDVGRAKEGLVMEGYGWVNATFMGGNMLLLSSSNTQSIKEAVESNKVWWEGWFRSILAWSPDLFHDRREVWLRCRGVPLHAWDESLFRTIAESLGTFIELDEDTLNLSNFEVARVKISTSRMAFIDTMVNIMVLEKQYQISVAEESGRGRLEEVGGGRRVGEWASMVSSMASAV
jgi:hypothetical protein